MSDYAATLRELHRIHRQRADLNNRLARGPKQIAIAQKSITQFETLLQESKELGKKTRMLADDKQLQLRQREDRIKDLQTKLNGCKSNKEFQLLKEQIAADEQANSVLSDEILELLEKIDEIDSATSQSVTNVDKATQEHGKVKLRIDEESAHLNSELDRVNGQLETAEAKIPLEIKTDYLRVASAKGEDSLAQVEQNCCGNCYQTLNAQTINNLFLEKPIFCPNCGSLLYLEENRSIGT